MASLFALNGAKVYSRAQQHQNCPCVGASVPRPVASRPLDQRGSRVAAYAYVPTLGGPRLSLDPLAADWGQAEWQSGRLLTIKSPQQFEELKTDHPNQLVVLMCKSYSCRPCKMFTRKYMAIAERFPEVICCEVYGDETPETRKMMMQLEVKATPTFQLYRQGECVNTLTGTNDKKLMRGMLAHLFPSELVNHEREIQDTMSLDEADQPQTAAGVKALARA